MFIYKVTEGHKRLSNKLQNAKNDFAKKVTKAEAEEVLDVENILKGGIIPLAPQVAANLQVIKFLVPRFPIYTQSFLWTKTLTTFNFLTP